MKGYLKRIRFVVILTVFNLLFSLFVRDFHYICPNIKIKRLPGRIVSGKYALLVAIIILIKIAIS